MRSFTPRLFPVLAVLVALAALTTPAPATDHADGALPVLASPEARVGPDTIVTPSSALAPRAPDVLPVAAELAAPAWLSGRDTTYSSTEHRSAARAQFRVRVRQALDRADATFRSAGQRLTYSEPINGPAVFEGRTATDTSRSTPGRRAAHAALAPLASLDSVSRVTSDIAAVPRVGGARLPGTGGAVAGASDSTLFDQER